MPSHQPDLRKTFKVFLTDAAWFTEHAAGATELIDDVDDADKRSDNDKYLDRRYRKVQAYEAWTIC